MFVASAIHSRPLTSPLHSLDLLLALLVLLSVTAMRLIERQDVSVVTTGDRGDCWSGAELRLTQHQPAAHQHTVRDAQR